MPIPRARLESYSLFCREGGDDLIKAGVAARRVPAYFAVWQPRVTDPGPHPHRRADQGRSPEGKPGKLPAARHQESLPRTFRKL
jgi:hypothetical protein